MNKDDYIKVQFHLEQDEDGYPPCSEENLWCFKTPNGSFIVDNIPFYIYDISLGDEISIIQKDCDFIFQSIYKKSQNSTLRLYFDDIRREVVKQQLIQMGCRIEGSNIPSLFAVNVPFDVSLKEVENTIQVLKKEYEELEYEHGSIRQ